MKHCIKIDNDKSLTDIKLIFQILSTTNNVRTTYRN